MEQVPIYNQPTVGDKHTAQIYDNINLNRDMIGAGIMRANIYELPDTIEEVRKLHRKYEKKYNCERMHQCLNYLTPMDYYYTLKEKAA